MIPTESYLNNEINRGKNDQKKSSQKMNQDKVTRLLKRVRIIPHESHVICGNKDPLSSSSRLRHYEDSFTNTCLPYQPSEVTYPPGQYSVEPDYALSQIRQLPPLRDSVGT